jgi:hypothetical protein
LHLSRAAAGTARASAAAAVFFSAPGRCDSVSADRGVGTLVPSPAGTEERGSRSASSTAGATEIINTWHPIDHARRSYTANIQIRCLRTGGWLCNASVTVVLN